MINMNLSRAAQNIDAKYQGQDVAFSGCSIDSRTINSGELFIAIRGEHFDGHAFLNKARQHGAVAAMIDTEVEHDFLPVLKVSNTRQGMGKLAQYWRDQFDIPLVAITGSNGKTTVKEMLVAILGLKANILSTKGNLNNDIGVPLTLFGLGNEHTYAIIEMGANHPGEIRWLSQIARPTVAVITQCAPAHLEGFGSVEGVAQAKSEIYEGLDKKGIAVINADDDYADLWRSKIKGLQQLSFGIVNPADVSAKIIPEANSHKKNRFILNTPEGSSEVQLSLLGQHNVMNALAAATCAIGLGISLDTIKQGLEKMQPVKGRLEIKTGINNSRIIDDTYNANPASLMAAINVLNTFNGKHWLVLGDMGELGTEEEELHAVAGEQAKKHGVERLFATGKLSQLTVKSFGKNAEHFETTEDLSARLKSEITSDVILLVKGSRSMHMEKVVNGLEMKNPC